MILEVAFIIFSYLIGSIPFGLIFSKRLKGIDPREKGSGNIGFSNVVRVAGKKAGFLTLAGDVFKGFIPVALAKAIWHDPLLSSTTAIAAVLGHNHPIFLRFKGGKGVATSFGVIFTINPLIGLLLLVIWLAVVFIWRYSSLGAIVSFTLLPFITFSINNEIPYRILSVLLAVMILLRHKDNIKRLLDRKETRMWGVLPVIFCIMIFTALPGYASTSDLPDQVTLNQDTFGSDPLGKITREWFNRKDYLKSGDKAAASKSLTKIKELAMTHGIRDLDVFSAALVKEGYLLLAEEKISETKELAESARILSPDYPPVYYLLAKISWAEDKANIFMFLDNYLKGLLSMTANIKIAHGKIREIVTGLFVILSLSFIFFLFSTLFFRYSPFLEHNLGLHKLPSILSRIKRPLLWLIIFTPIFITSSLGWLILFWILIVWVYLSLKERVVIIAFLALFAISVFILPYIANILVPGDIDFTDAFLRYKQGNFEKRNRGDDISVILRALINENPEAEEPYILLALTHKKRKEYEAGKLIYQELLKKNHNSAEVYNNLGNVYYFLKDYDQALRNYVEAIKIKSNFVPVYYNMSQIYRERFMFDEGERNFQKAEALDPVLVNKYTELSRLDPAYVVIDLEPTSTEIWPYSFNKTSHGTLFSENIWNLIFKEISIHNFPILILSIVFLLSVMTLVRGKLPVALLCRDCGRVFCRLCDNTISSTERCSQCIEDSKTEKTDPKKRVERLLVGRGYKSSQKLFGRVITIILPGTGHIYYGYPIKGLFYLILSFSILFLIFNRGGLYGENPLLNLYPGGFAYYIFIIGSLLLYLIIVRDLFFSRPVVREFRRKGRR